jgi:serine/threonine-protein kinase
LHGQAAALTVGSYVLLELLGEGGMGQVFKARHQKLGRTAALKVLHPACLGDGELVGRFYREMQATSRLEHRNVVRAFDSGPVGHSHVLIMEYAEGIDLDRLVRERGALPLAQACDYCVRRPMACNTSTRTA